MLNRKLCATVIHVMTMTPPKKQDMNDGMYSHKSSSSRTKKPPPTKDDDYLADETKGPSKVDYANALG